MDRGLGDAQSMEALARLQLWSETARCGNPAASIAGGAREHVTITTHQHFNGGDCSIGVNGGVECPGTSRACCYHIFTTNHGRRIRFPASRPGLARHHPTTCTCHPIATNPRTVTLTLTVSTGDLIPRRRRNTGPPPSPPYIPSHPITITHTPPSSKGIPAIPPPPYHPHPICT